MHFQKTCFSGAVFVQNFIFAQYSDIAEFFTSGLKNIEIFAFSIEFYMLEFCDTYFLTG